MDATDYKRPWFLFNGHLETIWPSLFRMPPQPRYQREILEIEDGDFLLLDWVKSGNERLAVVSHGLEGDTNRHYVAGMVNALAKAGWDVLAWNFRGCGGQINRRPKFTHNGATEDLDAVVRHALAGRDYGLVSLVGFSMGGNLSLVYLGRDADKVPGEVGGAVCLSVPCDLAAASEKLAEPQNAIYMKRFMRMMGEKVKQQAENYPEHFPCADYHLLKTFSDFDSRYTAPLHGFVSAKDYWYQCSSTRYLKHIRVPTWIINAVNDPFLTPSCSPDESVHGNSLVTMLRPSNGGHCGFVSSSPEGAYWSEIQTVKLLAKVSR